MTELPLNGGRLTPGVVRIKNTVRRPSSPFTADLLHLLAERGFTAAPKYLGQDDSGRDILTYIDGWVPARFQRWSDDQIAAAGALLRAFHDATRGSHLAASHPVVCHHDPGPNNFVFQDDVPTALIDFDLAAPGDPLEDLGYAAWTWCIASKYADPTRQAHQVRVLTDAYGLPAAQRSALVPAILNCQLRNADFWTQRPCAESVDRVGWSHREYVFTSLNRHVFEAVVS
ncbi:phosphotransferase [Kribbella kalugense]|uniref:Phosphotransferase family enzyme n=1 Tax=Kribbella kalugense TaxID=2512221 RepID=A0A4R7ZFT6_9ACTN|nr:phosphotransferase [Kribbella kalugense]TDW15108.1 phosphotransferase family enzyme [Kribbella kalugense]